MGIKEVLDNSGCLNPEDLCLVPGKLAWVLYLDLVCLNHDGNVYDAALKALVAALKNLRVPKVTTEVEDEDEKDGELKITVDPETRSPLQLGPLPYSCTLAILDGGGEDGQGDQLLMDPTWEEETFASSSVTVVLTPKVCGDEDFDVCHVFKPGGSPVSRETLSKCTSLAKKQAKKIKK